MRQIVLASHHGFAQGLADTLEFLGNKNIPHVICAYMDDMPLTDTVENLFASFSPADEVLILTDIMQGSVNQAFVPYVGEHVFLVAGVNVALALELCLTDEPLSNELIQQEISTCLQSIQLINTLIVEEGEDDE